MRSRGFGVDALEPLACREVLAAMMQIPLKCLIAARRSPSSPIRRAVSFRLLFAATIAGPFSDSFQVSTDTLDETGRLRRWLVVGHDR